MPAQAAPEKTQLRRSDREVACISWVYLKRLADEAPGPDAETDWAGSKKSWTRGWDEPRGSQGGRPQAVPTPASAHDVPRRGQATSWAAGRPRDRPRAVGKPPEGVRPRAFRNRSLAAGMAARADASGASDTSGSTRSPAPRPKCWRDSRADSAHLSPLPRLRTVLYYTILCYAMLYDTILYYTIM